jgi:Secretion system C-terminal sorting domain
MRDRLILILALQAITIAASAQGTCNQVVAATGRTVVKQGNTWSYTVGEPFIMTLKNANSGRVVTQGFHQPELCVTVSTGASSPLVSWDVSVFPNPTSGLLNIRWEGRNASALRAYVFDITGRPVMAAVSLSAPDSATLDVGALQSGIYFLQLLDPATSASASLRFIVAH